MQTHRRLWRWRCATGCLLLSLLTACIDSAQPMDLAPPVRRAATGAIVATAPAPTRPPAQPPARASLFGIDDLGSWVVLLRDGRVHSIRELRGAPGHWRVHLYAFDTLGTLRAYSDRSFLTTDKTLRNATMLTDETVLDVHSVSSVPPAPDELIRTAVRFEAGLPILYARRGTRGPHSVHRVEFRNLVARAKVLYAYAQTRQATPTVNSP